MDFAVIQDDVIVNLIVAETKEIAEEVTGNLCVEFSKENHPLIGWAYNSTSGEFISPPPAEVKIETPLASTM
jgi:hypothetical protein